MRRVATPTRIRPRMRRPWRILYTTGTTAPWLSVCPHHLPFPGCTDTPAGQRRTISIIALHSRQIRTRDPTHQLSLRRHGARRGSLEQAKRRRTRVSAFVVKDPRLRELGHEVQKFGEIEPSVVVEVVLANDLVQTILVREIDAPRLDHRLGVHPLDEPRGVLVKLLEDILGGLVVDGNLRARRLCAHEPPGVSPRRASRQV